MVQKIKIKININFDFGAGASIRHQKVHDFNGFSYIEDMANPLLKHKL